MREIDPRRQYGKLVAHMVGALVATVAFAAVSLLDPEMLRWVLALIVAGNFVAAVAAYIGIY
jgi:hypothetical protein